ncbi:TIM barrel protein [Devosia sp. 2618]|uniref:sugar phosphate isomerase/epimerase family protein n=1 Tax=Devosia sp. 2618 TaxID=3156454 RepID=UPI00339A56C8
MSLMPGLCSVALRHLDPQQVVNCAIAGKAAGIEWEARIHVPPGDRDKAHRAAGLTADAGLSIPSYGAYARAGSADARDDFVACLISAESLGAPMIRVWAGSTEGLSGAERDDAAKRVASDLADFCDRASDIGKIVSLEFHPGTFTEDARSTLDLIERVGRANLLSHWQPDYGQSLPAASNALTAILPVLSHLHVFYWTKEHLRLPLSEGRSYWQALLGTTSKASSSLPFMRFAMLEFSQNDDPGNVVADLLILHSILKDS